MLPVPMSTVFDMYFAHHDLDQETILLALEAVGVPPEVAWRINQFVPMACAHVMFAPEGVRFSRNYVSASWQSDERTTHALRHEPLYVEAFAEATRRQKECSEPRHLLRIACRSAEYAAISEPTSGSVSDLVLTEPVLFDYQA